MARRTIARALFIFLSMIFQKGAPGAAEQPDVALAYVLATASYCAYAVTEADADHGHRRAFSCLRAAAREDPQRLASLNVRTGDVEAYVALDRPEDAYLLVRTRKGAILAFRGTAPPPVLTSSTGAAERRDVDQWRIFFDDVLNDLDARANERGRHAGFDDSWGRLKEHLLAPCAASSSRPRCSLFRRFAGRMRRDGALYLTGHSKGGALAMLAGLDLPSLAGLSASPGVYTFAAAKAVTATIAAQAATAAQDWWRFERESDIVPSLPPDATLPLWIALGSPYAHLGNLVYFTAEGAPALMLGEPAMIVPPGDWARAPAFLLGQAGAVAASWLSPDFLTRLLNSKATACRALVDNHFKALVDVQRLAGGAGEKESFFAKGLYDRDANQILWGFRQWCDQLKIVDSDDTR